MRFIKYLSMLCLIIATQAFAKISVNIQPNPVAYGNPVELVFSSTTAFSGVPNLTVIQKDFVIGGQQQRQSSSWVNGVGKANYELAYTLFPNKTGKITIPSFTIGSETTSEQTLTVLDKSASGGAKVPTQDGLELNVTCDKTEIYPQQMLHCAAELIDPIGVRNGELTPPSDPDFTWQPISDVQVSVKNIKGQNVRVLKQDFIFRPSKSGDLKIPAFLFQGSALDSSAVRNTRFTNMMDFMFMDMIGSATRPVSAMSKPFSITVLPKPADWTGWWLPSTDVTLTETYQMPQTIHVGESIERTVTLKALDVSAETLPVPTQPTSSQIKTYTGVENRQDTSDGSTLTLTFTIIPVQAGKVIIPSISVPWFDTQNHVTRYAVVPERTIIVEGGDIAPVATTTPPPQTPTKPSQPTPTLPPEQTQSEWVFWVVLGTGIVFSFVIGVFVTLLLVRRKTSVLSNEPTSKKKKKPLPDLYPF